MRPRKDTPNPCLSILVEGAGFTSVESFAEAVNAYAWHQSGIRLSYDHVSVKRWMKGAVCQYPEAVAGVLSDAWGIPIPVAVIWPELRRGDVRVPPHQQAWVAARTLEDLEAFVRCDMLTRRDLLSDAVTVVGGTTLIDPINRWLPRPSTGVPAAVRPGTRIDLETVRDIEGATKLLKSSDAGAGGGLSREAGVGQLKYAVDLMQSGTYSEPVGARLLAAISRLASMVGWMCHDAGMEGPAQRYFLYSLQAARESTHEHGPLAAAATLTVMARQMRVLGHPDTGVQLVDQALTLVPPQMRGHAPARAMLLNLKGELLAAMGPQALPEVRSAVAASFDLLGEADLTEWTWQAELFSYTHEAELAGTAAGAFRVLAADDPRLADDAARYAERALATRPATFARSRVFDQIELARARFIQGEPEQACTDAETAITWSAEVPSSTRVTSRLHALTADSEPYRNIPRVKELRDHLQLVTTHN